jgi:hypothetical protein
MFLLLSGEGPSDIGCSIVEAVEICKGEHFLPGPMAWFVDQLVEQFVDQLQGFEMSHIEYGQVGFVSEKSLSQHCKQASGGRKIRLPGKKTGQETSYFFRNARGLGELAHRLADEVQDSVIAVLFRDSDRTASSNRGLRRKKVESMENGFKAARFDYGVPMMPNPKSEAWLLCAVKSQSPYQHCDALEEMSGNDKGLNPLKEQLEAAMGGYPSSDKLSDLVKDRSIDVLQIDMPSLREFREALSEAVSRLLRPARDT